MYFRSLAPLFESPKLDRELRKIIRETFPEFCSTEAPLVNLTGMDKETIDIPESSLQSNSNNHGSDLEPRFSDDESDDLPSPKKMKIEKINVSEKAQQLISLPPQKFELNTFVEQFSSDIKSCLLNLHQEK